MKKTIGMFVLALAILMSCAKKKSSDALPGSSFPSSVGSRFNYAVTDSNANKTFNVTVLIAGNRSLVGGTAAQLWTFTYPDRIDTNYVISNKDSVIFYDKTKTVVGNNYRFPFTVGTKWSEPYKRDTTTVLSSQQITVPAGTFSQAFFLKEHASAENYQLTRNQWVVPNIGMVKMYLKDYSFSTHVTTWELSSYHIN